MFAQNGLFLPQGLAESISDGGPCFRRHRRQAHLFPSSSAHVFLLLSSSAHVFLIPSSSAHVLPPFSSCFPLPPPGRAGTRKLHRGSQGLTGLTGGAKESHVQTSFPCAVSKPRYSSHYHQHHNSNDHGDYYHCDHYYHDYCYRS